jgi:hypothetical protein
MCFHILCPLVENQKVESYSQEIEILDHSLSRQDARHNPCLCLSNMSNSHIIGLLLLLSFSFLGCDFFDDDIVRFDVISEGSFSGIRAKTETVVDSQSEWTDVWEQHVSDRFPEPPLPAVDFTSSVIVAIFAGDKPDTCYRLFVREVSEDGDNVIVRYEIVKTSSDPGCGDAITQPFTMFRIRKPQGSISIIDVTAPGI